MRVLKHISVFLAALLVAGCANRGVGPQGGPKDETPPKILKESPVNGSTMWQGNQLVLTFDEYLQLNDASNQIIMSPPQQKPPVVKAVGKRVLVSFEQPLRDSTTYIIDFGSAICDNNEKNPVSGYTFAFATGPVIDTLQISGTVINAEDLNPVSGLCVGVHYDLSDSAVLKMPFAGIARTDAKGEFCVRNLRPGSYRLYALDDVSKDFVYQPGERIAFLDTVFVPSVRDSVVVPKQDTVPALAADSLSDAPADSLSDTPVETDTVRVRKMFTIEDLLGKNKSDSMPLLDSVPFDTVPAEPERITVYEPSGIVLRLFSEEKRRLYFQRCLREEQHCFRLLFSAPQDSLPSFVWLNDSLPSEGMIMQTSPLRDTITFWLTDSALITADTIPFVMSYLVSDSVYNLVSQTDTLEAVYRAPRLTDKAREALERKKHNRKLEFRSNASTAFDIYVPLELVFPTPLAGWQTDSMHFYELHDTVRTPLPLVVEKADSSSMRLLVRHEWKAETDYGLTLDSAAFTDVYGVSSDKQVLKWKIRSMEDYSTLIIKVNPFVPHLMVQLLSDKDAVVRTLSAREDGCVFRYLKPQSYYVRVYEDLNGDSVWTTGDFERKRQPEPVYYFPQKLSLRANWDFEETVNWQEKDILEQKPTEIRQDAAKKKK